MSRFSSWLLAVLGTALAATGASACPGSMAIGLPLLFGSDEPSSPWPASSGSVPFFENSKPPLGLEEAAEFGDEVDRKAMAQECLKVWRQLVRDGRFDLAPTVAAKAASLDPTNIDVQHAVIVSQVLRNIDDQTKHNAKTDGATNALKAMAATAAGCEADVCPACPEQKSGSNPANVTASQPPRSFQLAIPLPFISGPNLPGSGLAVKYLIDAASPKAALPPLPKVEALRPEARPIAAPTENEMIAERALKHLFPAGLLTSEDPIPGQNVSTTSPSTTKGSAERFERALEREINRAFPDSAVQLRFVGDKVVVAGQAFNSIEATQIIRVVRANAPSAEIAERIPGDCISPYTAPPGLENYRPHSTVQIINMLHVPGDTKNPLPSAQLASDNVIPARNLPTEYLAQSKDNLKTIPLTALRQPKQDVYRLAAGDVLGIFIDGVLGEKDQSPPVTQATDRSDLPPAIGFPIAVRDDGTISLPQLPPNCPLKVTDKTLREIEKMIRDAYTSPDNQIVKDNERIIVSLVRPRQYAVQVVRQGTPQTSFAGLQIDARPSLSGVVVLPAYKNDLLNALQQTGGLPGLDLCNEVSVQRELKDGTAKVIRIPLRIREGESLPFQPKDVILESGDFVFIAARDNEVYYVGGLSSPQFPLPRDYDLRVRQAVILSSLPAGFSGIPVNDTSLFPHVTVIRRTKNNGQVKIHVDLNLASKDPRENIVLQSGDRLILPEPTPSKPGILKATAEPCDAVTPNCDLLQLGIRGNTDGGSQDHFRTVGHAIPADANKRVTIKTAAWQVECDRIVSMTEREMVLDGNVNLTMRQVDVSVQASRVRVNLTDGSIQVDGK